MKGAEISKLLVRFAYDIRMADADFEIEGIYLGATLAEAASFIQDLEVSKVEPDAQRRLDNLTDAIVENILSETDEEILSECSHKEIDDWRTRAKALSDAAWNAVNDANAGASFVDSSTPTGKLSEIALELATHLGAAGRVINELNAELNAVKRGLRSHEKPDAHQSNDI